MELYGKKVRLRAIEESDLEMLRNLSNTPDFEHVVVGWSFPISKKDQLEWYSSLKSDAALVRYIIETDEDGAVGACGLRNIDWKNGSTEGAGMRIAKKDLRSKGLATDAWMTLLRYAFEELRLNRFSVETLEYNEPSLHLCQKVGFKIEGVRKSAIYKNGEYHDLICLGILKKDYEEKVKETKYWDDENE